MMDHQSLSISCISCLWTAGKRTKFVTDRAGALRSNFIILINQIYHIFSVRHNKNRKKEKEFCATTTNFPQQFSDKKILFL